MGFGERIKRLRLEKDWSQEDVATRMGVNRAAVSNWEHSRREPPIETLRKLAGIYGVTVDYLLGRSNVRDHAAGEDLALKWPRLSPDRRLRAAEIERGMNGPGMFVRFPPDIENETFDNLLRTFANLTQLVTKKPD